MLQFLRKHTGLIMFVLALVFVGLAFFGDNFAVAAPGRGASVMTSKTGTYGYKDYQVLGEAPQELLRSIPYAVAPMQNFITFWGYGTKLSKPQFFANRMILREEAKRLGIVPSSEQIEAKIRSFPVFQTEDGAFNSEAFREVEKALGRYGLTTANYYELVQDSLSFDRMLTLVSTGLDVDSAYLDAEFNSIAATQDLKTATLNLDLFKQDDQIADDKLKEYWEPNKNRYMSEELRSATVYVFSPLEKVETPATDKTNETEDNNNNVSKIPAPTQKVTDAVEFIWDEVVNKLKGSKLDETVTLQKEANTQLYTVKKEELVNFSLSNPPELIKGELNPAAGKSGSLVEAIFEVAPGGTKSDNISDALIMLDGNVALFEIKEITESKPLSFELAKEAALVDYRAEQAEKRLNEAAEKLQQSMVTGLAENKNFDDIAKEAQATPTKKDKLASGWMEYYGLLAQQGQDPSYTFTLIREHNPEFEAARKVNVNLVPPVISLENENSRIVEQVISKTLEDSPQTTSIRQIYKMQFNQIAKMNLLADWFRNEYERRNVKFTEKFMTDLERSSD